MPSHSCCSVCSEQTAVLLLGESALFVQVWQLIFTLIRIKRVNAGPLENVALTAIYCQQCFNISLLFFFHSLQSGLTFTECQDSQGQGRLKNDTSSFSLVDFQTALLRVEISAATRSWSYPGPLVWGALALNKPWQGIEKGSENPAHWSTWTAWKNHATNTKKQKKTELKSFLFYFCMQTWMFFQ